ncbi:hypothetical protein SDRG_12322 [Saprolegnia diclina VS20]|uniref:F-box domain-containing protein n=1 Tax=Saprolegnia diclina (strain VS20) TaxID=1156394 RepID=T0Q9A2_SAPDV|nr:hypothetical protein SDRG_12322 [Saprolegnia diclina VS20]EQC30045.1 hypothetical protein SDRG_12322 [Saprolegnia diclina VS20]|eukprot:XP_008616612.1 hypothetical protein SDRG_12322 [Saprolegnia diclina VS20]
MTSHIPDLVAAIAQFARSPNDVVALLHAVSPVVIPPNMTPPPPATILDAYMASFTRHLSPNVATVAEIDRVAEATGVVWLVQRADRRLRLCAFVALGAASMTSITVDERLSDSHGRRVGCLLRLCSGLEHASLPLQPALLEAALSASQVRALSLCPPLRGHPLQGVDHITHWLASAGNGHLSLQMLRDATNIDLAQALTSSPHLARLSLHHCEGLVGTLMANGARFCGVTELFVSDIVGTHAHDLLLPLLRLPAMTTLSIKVNNPGPVTGLATALPQLEALQELLLARVHLLDVGAMPVSVQPTIRTLTFDRVLFTPRSLSHLLDWVTRSAHLDSISFPFCTYFQDHPICAAQALWRSLHAGGRFISFTSCSLITLDVQIMVRRLRETHVRHRAQVDLTFNPFRLQGIQALACALSTCTNVSIKVRCSRELLLQVTHAGIRLEETEDGAWLHSP